MTWHGGRPRRGLFWGQASVAGRKLVTAPASRPGQGRKGPLDSLSRHLFTGKTRARAGRRPGPPSQASQRLRPEAPSPPGSLAAP